VASRRGGAAGPAACGPAAGTAAMNTIGGFSMNGMMGGKVGFCGSQACGF
jgi:hypothetical protein